MSISFYVKNKRKIINYEPVLTVKEALALSDKELNVFAIPDMNINKLLLSPLSNYECLLIGVKNKSARGFELSCKNFYSFIKRRLAFSIGLYKNFS